jgi:predicted 2-oxoglutarate/Fe(II)-dependent dioxygenase YbiX
MEPRNVNPLPAEFFTRFGLYAEREFLSPDVCASLRDEMRTATGAPATVAEGQEGHAVVETYRRTKKTDVSPATSARIGAQLLGAVPGLAKHFGRELVGMQKPQFLLYRVGDFFRPHEDDSGEPDAPDFVRQRSVSAVVFLNGATTREPAGYSGGSLTFYGLMDEASGDQSVGLPLAGETGLLIAFPSHLLHSVSPVTAGERYTLVSWFFEDPSLSVSERSETVPELPGSGLRGSS